MNLKPCRKRLGIFLLQGSFGRRLGTSWEAFGVTWMASWGSIGQSWEVLGSLRRSGSRLGCFLGSSLEVFGGIWAALEAVYALHLQGRFL